MLNVKIIDPSEDGCYYYRSYLYHKHTCEQLWLKGIKLEVVRIPNPSYSDIKADLVLFRRMLNPQVYCWIDLLQLEEIPYVHDVDDLLSAIPDSNPTKRNLTQLALKSHELMLARSRVITTSTSTLRESLGWEGKTLILPNLIDLDDWVIPQSNLSLKRSEKVILFHGSPTHSEDLALVIPAIKKILKRKDVVVYLCGEQPSELIALERVYCFGWQPIWSFPRFLSLLKPDICLCPLVDNQFNRCKSNIKWMESTMAGATVLASPVQPYNNLPVNYCIDDWYENMFMLLEDNYVGIKNWENSIAKIKAEYSWSSLTGKHSADSLEKLVCNLVNRS